MFGFLPAFEFFVGNALDVVELPELDLAEDHLYSVVYLNSVVVVCEIFVYFYLYLSESCPLVNLAES